tara:strand:- start:284 stop:601 length:318 start_codon:yes stop_codon:yes gene_type:complete
MASTSKGIAPDRLTGIFGSQYIPAGPISGLRVYAFIVQEDDTIISLLKGGDASLIGTPGYVLTEYNTSMGLDTVTLKKGALLTAPEGEIFTEMTVSAGGAIIGYK